MDVVVFDTDVLIGFLNAGDAHHEEARKWMTKALRPRIRRMLCAVNYAELLVGPIKAGKKEIVDAMLVRFGIETMTVDMDLARRTAAVRDRTGLKLPDAFALATCIHAEKLNYGDVELASFDDKVLRAHAQLHLHG